MKYVILLLLACVAIQRCSATPCVADVNMAGLTCSLSFAADASDNTQINISSLNGPNAAKYDGVEIREFPAFFGGIQNSSQVCANVGSKTKDVVAPGTVIGGMTVNLPSFNESGFLYRTVLLTSTDPTVQPVCASVLPVFESITVRKAKFLGPNVVGTVWMNTIVEGTFITGELSYVNGKTPSDESTELLLMMFRAGSIDDSGEFSDRCSGLGNPVEIISVRAQHSVMSEGRFAEFRASITSPSTYLGLVEMGSGTVVSCAELRVVQKKTVTSVMNWEGVKGYFKFTQESPFTATQTSVYLTGLQNRTKGFHVHKYPVPQRLSSSENRCAPQYVSGHFNPFGVDVTGSPSSGTGTNDQYEIGDLSGKYGTLAGFDSINKTYTDWNLPLFGPNSIVGRSMVIHNSDGSRLMCGSIGYPGKVTTALTVFKSPIYGTMYFRQDANNPEADTTVFIELASQKKTETLNHNWHVHVYQVNDDAFNSAKPCASAGPHYNPSGVSVVDPPYKTECRSNDPLRCELGDTSGRLGKLNVAVTQRTEAGKFFFTDEYLPLSGPYSVLGRSVVVHQAGGAAARYSCANITQLQPVYARTDKGWKGKPDGTVKGQFSFEQATEFDLTKVTGSVTGLASMASGYHIHQKTIAETLAATEQACDPTSVAGHYNPFNITVILASTVGTFDQYEVGDLSNKYGLMDDVNNYSVPVATMDTNLPLFTSLASMDKSIVIHKKEAGARWKCTNFFALPVPNAGGHVITATVRFNSDDWAPNPPLLSGTIKLRQVVYEDGGYAPTSIEVDVAHVSNPAKTTLRHNWHIHIDPITMEDSCKAALGHYDPYGAINNTDYSTDCTSTNPLFCEVGDLSNKQAKYDIGGGRELFHDVDTPLHTEFTVLGRSIVFHVENAGADRFACSNIVPDDNTYTLAYPASETSIYDRYTFTKSYANALGISRLRLVVLHNIDVPVVRDGCERVMVHIAGGISSDLEARLLNGELVGLGSYASTQSCKNEKGANMIGMTTGSQAKHTYCMTLTLVAVMVVNMFSKLW